MISGGCNMNWFEIDMQLPSHNEYQRASRTSWAKGAEFKEEIEDGIKIFINIAKGGTLHKVDDYPVVAVMHWYEGTKKRDADNIISSMKFILDSLVSTGVLQGDSRKFVSQIYPHIYDHPKGKTKRRTYVRVYLIPESDLEEVKFMLLFKGDNRKKYKEVL